MGGQEGAGSTECHALVLWFDVAFTSRFCKQQPVVLSTSPAQPPTHWQQAILTLRCCLLPPPRLFHVTCPEELPQPVVVLAPHALDAAVEFVAPPHYRAWKYHNLLSFVVWRGSGRWQEGSCLPSRPFSQLLTSALVPPPPGGCTPQPEHQWPLKVQNKFFCFPFDAGDSFWQSHKR